MKAEELRIGNLVKSGSLECYINFFLGGEVVDLKPIPLTEEWLLRFAFVKEDDNYELKQIRINLNHQTTKIGAGWIGVDVHHCEYVHQLQNLYHALTGKELTIKND